MNRKMLSVGVALLMTFVLAGAAAAATPMTPESGHGFGKSMGGIVARVATFLRVDVASVQEERAAGQTLADILGNKTEAFIAASVAERQVFLAGLVDSGKITQAQADLCMAQVAEKLNERLTSDTTMHGAGAQDHAIKKMVQRRQNRQNLLNKGS